ncbi:hypothetical protein CC1G_00533 [Coprinopsis cinerea okayama7|uniref:Uncharacterized protein n=1 Tax=Coprinopsis cinerea (strain Okayama-7 / 130 / ATCC MYA-4618 / FGSC 9003) TaxID=240176 RepID=A8N3A9_COPC7|nr:hypothetical protein CC1G_00533 [Coprinopsis cinerea okayama7\|eukprot:XP_001829354.2 hypothetical protein CC1G_00533 [Coprinopsis cinerea okayama7\
MSTNGSDPSQPEATSSNNRFPIAKAAAVGRFKSFAGSFVPKKKKKSEPLFPPPSWNIEDFNPSSTNWTIPSPEPAPPPEIQTGATTDAAQQDANEVVEVEPVTLAKRLRAMIELLPIPGSLVPSSSTPSSSAITPKNESPSEQTASNHAATTTTPPIPPDMDKNLVQILSDEEVMNGDNKGKGKGRPGVWNLLAGLRKNDASRPEGAVSPIEEQEGGVMMYAPLDPKSDSVVELARTETIRSTDSSTVTSPSSSNPSLPSPEPAEIKLWVPSTTELSVLTTWWGYRLYLPPPVMAKLGATSVKAAARAAMITSALKWLIDKIPILLIPAQFRPAIKMLKSLTPFAGYVGVFIAWSWDRIRALDEGNGVVLTATWLLPVALIPMAWDAGDIFGPKLPPEIEEDIKHAGDDKGEKDDGKDKKGQAAETKPLKKSRFVW